MSKALIIDSNTEQGIIDFLKDILNKGKIKGVFTLKRINKNGDVAYSLITKKDDLDDAIPFYPLMPVNAGYLLSRFTTKQSSTEPLIAILKPCEIRAFIELIKREQGSINNIVIMSSTCGGVFTYKIYSENKVKENLSKYWEAVKKSETLENLRPSCKSCEKYIPFNSDITVDLIGKVDLDKKTTIFFNTKNGENLAKDIKAKLIEKDLDSKKLEKIKVNREKNKNELFKNIDSKLKGLDGLIDIFGRCISCHACGRVCPICYCTLCEFESSDSEYTPSKYITELDKKGAMRVPHGTVYYQLGRLDHISISCVGCGSCGDACPVDIPVSIIFKKIGESVQKMFNYTPGKDLDEELPLSTFKKEELNEFEE